MKVNANETPAMPPPPSLVAALMAGFDSITSHIFLIFFPLILDLLLWLGPHLKVTQVAKFFADQSFPMPTGIDAVTQAQFIQANQAFQDFWRWVGDHYNLLSLVRTYPVGIPSLMSASFPVSVPKGLQVVNWQINSWLVIIGLWAILIFSGLVIGSLYYVGVADAATGKSIQLGKILSEWPWAAAQVLLLTFIWVMILMAVTVPAFCIISAVALGNMSLGRFVFLVYGAGLLWMLFPLLLSTHGIFVNRNNSIISIRQGIKITRMTLPTTGLLFLCILLINQGLEIVWRIPTDNSWLTLVGITGHAFVTTGLLAASFVYYREADQWMQRMQIYWAHGSQAQSKINS